MGECENVNRILIVDPEAGLRADLEQVFADRGDDVAWASSCAEGLEVAAAVQPAAVLCAVTKGSSAVTRGRTKQSGTTSADFCRTLRRTFSRERLAIVLYARAPIDAPSIAALLDAGADAVAGPDQVGAVEALLDAALRNREALRGAAETIARLRDDNQRLDREFREHVGRVVGEHASDPSLVANELVASRPDGVLVVGTDGRILCADMGAHELLGHGLAGRSIGSVVPRSRLAAFVGKAGPDDHDRFSFDVDARSDRAPRRLQATVTSVTGGGEAATVTGARGETLPVSMRIVLLLDLDRRGPVECVARNVASRVPDRYYRRLLRVARAHHALEAFPRRAETSKRLFHALVGASRTLQPVLLRGPRGSGRGACAEILHHARHSTGPFLELSCDGLGEASQEAELFGERGVKGKASAGLVARSKDGTLVLHDLEHLSLAMQTRIVAIAKDRHLRIVATTSSSTEVLVSSGRLLKDLASVFAGSVIDVPPLRERRQDLPEMISRIVGRDTFDRMTTPAIQALVAWDWPGGVAEFERELARIKSLGACAIDTVDLDPEIVSHAVLKARPELLREVEISSRGSAPQGVAPAVVPADAKTPSKPPITSLPTKYGPGRMGAWIPERSDWLITEDDPVDLDLYLRKALLRALAMAKGDRTKAAQLAGIGKSTFYRKLRDWDLSGPETPEAQPRPPMEDVGPGDDAEASPRA